MSTIIGTATHTPEVIVGFSSSRQSRNIEHQTLGGGVSVTLRAPSTRTGTLQAVFETENEARALETDLLNARVFTATRDDLDDDTMLFVPNGRIAVDLNTESFVWVVSIDFREVIV
jgi:hypothetical protein